MRFFKEYRFQVGRKIDFKDLFEVVDTYLSEQRLQYASMGYDLLSLHDRCYKLAQKIPQLGPIEKLQGRNNDVLRLSNMTVPTHPCDDVFIRLAGSKIPRPYNFFDTHFYYRNITFFGEQPFAERIGYMPNPMFLEVSGSYIELYRSFEGPQTTVVFMKIEVTDRRSCIGADEYACALGVCLGNAKYTDTAAVYMDPSEKELYDRLKQAAAPIVRAAREDLYDRCEQMREQMLHAYPTFEQKRFNLSKPLKRMGKEHGFENYQCLSGNLYLLSKRVDGGHFVRIEVSRDPGQGIDANMILSGPGFSYDYPVFYGAPESQAEADWHISRMFEITDYFEARYMHDILALYPSAPDWCPECI